MIPDPRIDKVPHLMGHLYQEYIRSTEAANPAERSLDGFVAFCDDYLAKNRPVMNWPADQNIGFQLSNNINVLICPPIPEEGQMQPSGAVNVTHGQSQPGQDGVVKTNSKRVI